MAIGDAPRATRPKIKRDAALQSSIERSCLAEVPSDLVDALFVGSRRQVLPSGTQLYREGIEGPPALVVRGLLRVYGTAADGRQVTALYARPGRILRVPGIVRDFVPGNVVSLSECDVVALDPKVVRDLARRDPRVTWALMDEIIDILYGILNAFAGTAFGSVRERVARHVLNLSAPAEVGGPCVARVNAQELADAIASVREVTSRALRALEREGFLERSAAGLAVVDPERLHVIGWPGGHFPVRFALDTTVPSA